MNEIDKVLAIPIPVQIGGKPYRISMVTKGIQGEFSVWLKARARQAMLDAMEGAPPEAVALSIQQLKQDFLTPELLDGKPTGLLKYAWGGAVCREALMTDVSAMQYMLWLLLKPCQPSITLDDAWELVEQSALDVTAALNEVIEQGKRTLQQRKTA